MFSKWLFEAKGMVDISILAADKALNNKEKIEKFLTTQCTIEAKTDGVKLTVIKQANNGDINDWVFAYKGNVLYTDEYGYQTDSAAKTKSIGSSQFKLPMKHFAKIGKNSIPVGTELQIEYLMSKPTLSSNYEKKHGMVLIQYAKTTWDIKFGKLVSKPGAASAANRDKYAKELGLNVPSVLFSGILGSPITFKQGIKSPALKKLFKPDAMTWDDPEVLYNEIKNLFLAVPSAFGGTEEGVVIKTDNAILKWQQTYQLDQTARAAIKQRYREDDPLQETLYWQNVTIAARSIADSIEPGTEQQMMGALAQKLKRFKLDFSHSKKPPEAIKDDIQLNAKTLLLKKMKGNNGCLVMGKFRILTKGHEALIKKALQDYDNVCVCVVTSKDTAATQYLRVKMLRDTFGDKITLIEHPNGNIVRILDKVPFNVNVVYAGSDRVESYQQQLKNTIGVTVREMYRTNDDISASKVIANIDDKAFFNKNVPAAIKPMYDELKAVYGTTE